MGFGEGAAIFSPQTKSFLRRSQAHIADWVYAVCHCICVCVCAQVPFNIQCVSREWDCAVGLGGWLRKLSHGYKSSLLEQWLELTAVPVTGLPHSSDALCHSACGGLLIEKKPLGISEMLLKGSGYILYSET